MEAIFLTSLRVRAKNILNFSAGLSKEMRILINPLFIGYGRMKERVEVNYLGQSKLIKPLTKIKD